MSRRVAVGAMICLFSLSNGNGLSAIEMQSLESAIGEAVPAIVEIRHTIHRNPELGNREVETAALVAEELKAAGLETKEGVAYTGVVGVLRGGQTPI